jgi:SRSO17 transposase
VVTEKNDVACCDKQREDDWKAEFDRWVEPFLDEFEQDSQQKWCPIYLHGLMAPGERKSIEPMAARVCPGDKEQLNHFVAGSKWGLEGHKRILAEKASAMVGGPDAYLIIDDTPLVKQGKHSVGVAHQYCGQLGKKANCQVLVSVTLARNEVPVPLALQLYLPDQWANDPERRKAAKIPHEVVFHTKWRIALDEIDRVLQSKIEFGYLLADAGYGSIPEFRHELSKRNLTWAVGVHSTSLVYSKNTDVTFRARSHLTGRTPKIGTASEAPRTAKEVFSEYADEDFVEVCWRNGTKGPLSLPFAAVRVRPADGPSVKSHNHGPGDELWLVCEKRTKTDIRYYFSNCPADTSLEKLASLIKARWACEQGHQQMKEELGLDHFEGRSWHGLHHHTFMTMLAFAFLQHLRMQTQPGSRCLDDVSSIDHHRPHDPRIADPHDAHGCVETNLRQAYPCQKAHGAQWSAA